MRMDIFSEIAIKSNGRTILYTALIEIAELRQQVEKLTAELAESEQARAYEIDIKCKFSSDLTDCEKQVEKLREELFNSERKADNCQQERRELTKERDEYKSGFEAAASKYRNLKLQMQEIINVC